ncbi:MAG: hypothetical protein U1F83_17135 [Verrucomicrobiota bacterium]
MDQVFDSFVTINAIQFGMDGFVEEVGREEQGNNIRPNFAGGGRIEVAVEAVRVGEFFRGESGQSQPANQRPGKNQFSQNSLRHSRRALN